MKIRFSKKFEKQYKKLPKHLQTKVQTTIAKFVENPHLPSLKNHKLKGLMSNKRAISVSGNVRLIFEQQDRYTVVTFVDVGGHDQVYK